MKYEYSVTNADLLAGMSRVSSIAQQAGISLAQLMVEMKALL
jgi:hypothetical protein